MDTKKYIDKITLEYLSKNKCNRENNQELILGKDDIEFYRKRIINTTRELIKKNIDTSLNSDTNIIIYNNTVQDSFNNYIKALIYYYKQEDKIDYINQHNGFLNNDDMIKISNNNQSMNDQSKYDKHLAINIRNLDNTLLKNRVKNRYDWGNFCKVDKKTQNNSNIVIPKIVDYDLKDPILRKKGIKNKI